MIVKSRSLRKYTAARGIRLSNATHTLVLRAGDKFIVALTATSAYIATTTDLKPRFKVSSEVLAKLETNSRKLVYKEEKSAPVVEKEIDINTVKVKSKPKSTLPADVVAPSSLVLIERVNKADVAPPSEFTVAKPAPHFTQRQLRKFFSTNKGKIQAGLRKAMSRVLAGRPDDSDSKVTLKGSNDSVRVQADISLSGNRFAHLEYKASIAGDYFSLVASVSVQSDTEKADLVFRTPAVKSFFTEYLKMRPKLVKSFGLPIGTTVGPFKMTSNLLTPYLSKTRYFVTSI